MRTILTCFPDTRRMRAGWLLLLVLGTVTLVSPQVQAQFTAIQPVNSKPEEPWKPKPLSIQPAGELIPLLKYRFLPSEAELAPGDAAPIYLRMRHEMLDAAWKAINENHTAWVELPLKDFPLAVAREFVQNWSGYLKQLEYGTHRAHCDWNYTLPEQHLEAIEILLPDAQSMRTWARLLDVKTRVEVAEGNLDAAINTIETGLAFGRHVANGPFLINRLVGIAICQMMLERVEELVQQPGVPNLYWALTVLPRPMIDLRTAIETERRMGELMVPELASPVQNLTQAEWSVRLDRLMDRLQQLTRKLAGLNQEPNQGILKGLSEAWTKATVRSRLLGEARKTLPERHGWSVAQVDAMSDDEVTVRYIIQVYQETRDTAFAAAYLPTSEFEGEFKSLESRFQVVLERVKSGPLAVLVEFLPALHNAHRATLKLDRRIAALRAVEAIRMQAATDGGKLPESWAAVKVVPIPVDPLTGVPFVYEVHEGSVEVSGRRIGNQSQTEIGFRLTIRP